MQHQPTQYVEQLFQWMIDGIQVHKCYDSSYINIYNSQYDIIELIWPNIITTTSNFRIAIQDVIKEFAETVFYNEQLWLYRCICFEYKWWYYGYITQGVSENLNFCELFTMNCIYWDQVSLTDKISQFQKTIYYDN